MTSEARLEAARRVVESHLERRETLEAVLLGDWRTPLKGLAPLGRTKEFFGIGGRSRAIALTSTRVLLLPYGRRGAGGWFDVQYDRRRVSAGRPQSRGSAFVVDLLTGLGPQTLKVGPDHAQALEDFCRRLGYRPR